MNILRPVYVLARWFKGFFGRTGDQKQLLPPMIEVPTPPDSQDNQLRVYKPQVTEHTNAECRRHLIIITCFGTTSDGKIVSADFAGNYGWREYDPNQPLLERHIQDAFTRLALGVHSEHLLDARQSHVSFYQDWASRVNEKLPEQKWLNYKTITCRFKVEQSGDAKDRKEINEVDLFNEFVLILREIFKLQESESIFTGFYLQCHRFVTEPVQKLVGQLQLLNEQIPVLESRMTTLRDITGSDVSSLSRLMDQYTAQRDRIHFVITESLAKMILAHGKCVLAAASTNAGSEAFSVSREIELLAKEAAEALQEADNVCSDEVVHLVPHALNS